LIGTSNAYVLNITDPSNINVFINPNQILSSTLIANGVTINGIFYNQVTNILGIYYYAQYEYGTLIFAQVTINNNNNTSGNPGQHAVLIDHGATVTTLKNTGVLVGGGGGGSSTGNGESAGDGAPGGGGGSGSVNGLNGSSGGSNAAGSNANTNSAFGAGGGGGFNYKGGDCSGNLGGTGDLYGGGGGATYDFSGNFAIILGGNGANAVSSSVVDAGAGGGSGGGNGGNSTVSSQGGAGGGGCGGGLGGNNGNGVYGGMGGFGIDNSGTITNLYNSQHVSSGWGPLYISGNAPSNYYCTITSPTVYGQLFTAPTMSMSGVNFNIDPSCNFKLSLTSKTYTFPYALYNITPTSLSGSGGINSGAGVTWTLVPDSTYSSAYNLQLTILPLPSCFLEGTKILTYQNGEEVYECVENLQKGMQVKTFKHGYVPIEMIGYHKIYNPSNPDRIKNRLYKCTHAHYPPLIEDLILTGCHSILENQLTQEEGERTMESLGKIYITEDMCRLMAFLDERAHPYEKEGNFPIWHIALQNDDEYMNYGIYANGLLVESASQRFIKENMFVINF
jgi:hypothetical protein